MLNPKFRLDKMMWKISGNPRLNFHRAHTSRYIRPNRSNGTSILPPSKTDESPNAFLAIDKDLLKLLMVWKLAGKKTSQLFQGAQEGKSLGMGESFG